jgi:hypothetical protein
VRWIEQVAKQLSKHSDAVAVVRAGKKAKRRTRRRDRRIAKMEMWRER